MNHNNTSIVLKSWLYIPVQSNPVQSKEKEREKEAGIHTSETGYLIYYVVLHIILNWYTVSFANTIGV